MLALLGLSLFVAATPSRADTTSTITDTLTSPGRCVDIPGKATAAGTGVEIWDCNGGANQQFDFVSATGEIVVYAGTSNAMCLNADGDVSFNGTKIIIWPCEGEANEKWTYNASTKTITGLNGACLSLPNSDSADGTFLQLYQCNGGANQQFNVSGTTSGGSGGSGGGGTTTTPAGVPLPSGWTLKESDQFGTSGNVSTYAQLHKLYNEGQYYNVNSSGLVNIPNVVINSEQETYTHFENAIVFSTDHLTIQARGQSNGSITSAEMVSLYNSRSFCIEARYTIPNAMYGWPAFWMYGNATNHDSSEIDVEQPVTANQGVSEVSLYNHPTEGNLTIADPKFTSQWMTWTNTAFNGSTGPHYYTTCYNDAASTVSRYIDGSEIYSSSGWTWNASLGGTGHGPNAYTIVNLAVGGSWPGDTPNPSAFSANMDVYSIQYYAP